MSLRRKLGLPRIPAALAGLPADSAPADPLGWAWHNARFTQPQPRWHDGVRTESASPRMRLLARACLLASGLAALAFAAGFSVFVSYIARSEQHPPVKVDGIVALTGGSQRINDAIDLLAAGYGKRLLISGVNERTSREEIARLNPSQRSWIDCCVDLDYRARNTIGNAIETRRWMRRNHFTSITVVTANYHMPRTMVEVGHVLTADQTAQAHPIVPENFDASRWWSDPGTARLLFTEYVKFLAAWLRTQVETDPETSRFAVYRGKPVKPPIRLVGEPPRLGAAN